jgi:hypothetical protein
VRRRLGWFLWAIALPFWAASVSLSILNRSTPTLEDQPPAALGLWFALLFLSFSTVGALVVARQPGNAIGWILCALGLTGPLGGTADGYAVYGLATRPDSLPEAEIGAWLSGWLGGGSILGLLVFILLLFPTGRPLSGRWRPVIWANGLALVLVFLWGFEPGVLDTFAPLEVTNPFGIERTGGAFQALGVVGFCLILGAAVAGLISLVLRFRPARGDERQQLKWLAYAAGLVCAAFLAGPVVWSMPSLPDWVWTTMFLVAFSAVPAAIGIALLRYRLYDVDVVINRTLVYGSVTALLAAAYLGLVLLFQLVFSPLTEENSLAVAVSTLAVAALFRPARNRVQALVDRRFYRSRYDAQQTLEGFAVRLREEVDLDALRAELTGVVAETMQPAHVSLWLRSKPGETV